MTQLYAGAGGVQNTLEGKIAILDPPQTSTHEK